MASPTSPAGTQPVVRDVEAAAKPLRAELARDLIQRGLLDDATWRHAVEIVPRHRFVPGFYAQTGRRDEQGALCGGRE